MTQPAAQLVNYVIPNVPVRLWVLSLPVALRLLSDHQRRPPQTASRYSVSATGLPAANFWSLTLYEAENASGLANGQPFPSLGSRDEPAQNPDSSTDLYLAPVAPDGKQKNWLATVRGRGFFAVLRLYGPTEPALTKTWKPGDVTKMK